MRFLLPLASFLALGAAKVSKDGTCGGSKGSTCLDSTFGNCCSSAGWCGSTSAYCGTGCQSGFGNCGSNNPVSARATSAAATPSAAAKKVSPDATCGGSSGYTCLGSSFGNCCSANGWCGSTTEYCGTGCQSGFGNCGSNTGGSSSVKPASSSVAPVSSTKVSSAAPTSTKKVSTDASCGGSSGYTCLGSTFGNCCSTNGWCGSTDAYCGSGCQTGFGNCGSNGGSSSQGVTSTKASTSVASTTKASSSASATASQSVMQCLNGKNVPYKMSSDSAYAGLVAPYNQRAGLAFKPIVVVYPTTNQHVQDAVVCAGQTGVKVQAKSGGHSYASFSSGGKDGSMMIDLEPFQTIALDKSSGVVQVGGGVRLGNLANGIYNQGQAALAHGTCPGVGIGGHATHGGYGLTSRNWGLAMDQITAVDVVLANGTLVKASASAYPEIFWAVRGAADSFGVVTTFYMQTHAAPSSITYFAFSYTGILDAKTTFTNTFLRIQEIAKNSTIIDSRIAFGLYLDNYGTYSLSGTFFGTVDEFNNKIKPEFLRNMPAPSQTPTVKSYGWIDYLVLEAGQDTIVEPTTGYDKHENFFAKSITVPESSGGLTSAALNAFYDQLKKNGAVEYFVIINLYGGPGSAINTKDTNFAAYSDRDSLWVFQNYGYNADSVDFINGVNNAIIKAQPQTSFGAYLNYVDPSYDAATAHKLYYGDALYAKLLSLKQQVDPKSVFWNPQAIGA